jgi:hypothetical protein
LLLKELERLARGEIDRLMILMPPGSAKSTYASMIFPAWWFVQHPGSAVIAASHTGDLALHFGRAVRNLIAEHESRLGYTLAQGNRAAGRWQISSKGQYFATGVRGPVAGRRADLIIIDDPIKSQAEADSAMLRDHIWNWYRSDLTTRLKPGGRIVLIMTRWHEDDLGGRSQASPASGKFYACPRSPKMAIRSAACQGRRCGPNGRTWRRSTANVALSASARGPRCSSRRRGRRAGLCSRSTRSSSQMADARCPMAEQRGPGTSPPRAMPEAAIPTGRSA